MIDPVILGNIFAFYSGVLQSVLAGEVTRKLTEHSEARSQAEVTSWQQALHETGTVDGRVAKACAQGMKSLHLDDAENTIFWPLIQDPVFTDSLPVHLAGNALSVDALWLRSFPAANDAAPEILQGLAQKLTRTALQAVASDTLLASILDLQQGAEIRRIVQRIEPDAALLPGLVEKVDFLLERVGQGGSAAIPSTTPASLREQILEAFGIASTALLRWPTTLDDSNRTRLEPKQTEAAQAGFDNANGSTTLLLGGPGSGKSALLAAIGGLLVDNGRTVLALKTDTLPQSIKSLTALEQHLSLPQDLVSCIRLMAEVGEVFVLVDQLDALADLVDLQPERLNVLLNLIRRLSAIPHVHVLASCREFEHRHDVRLTAIDATLVHLELPTWEEVEGVLARHDLSQTVDWPLALRDLLRSPQHLKVFLNVLRGGTGPELFSSYQMMMERLWRLRITNTAGLSGRSEFLDAVASRMANDEVLWLPLVQYESQIALINQLEAGGILVRAPDGRSFGFSHQTLFNYARARAFVRDQHGQSLTEYVLARQDALFVRPTLWSSLTYLRGADRQSFQREFGRLWSEPNLRMHVRLLLIEFLGQLEDPDDQEANWLLPRLEDSDQRGHALRAMAGRKGWFERLSPAYLPMIMSGVDPQDLNDVTAFLSEAWRTSYEGVLTLIQTHWSGDSGKDIFTWSTLESLREWDERTVDLACTLLKRGEVHTARVMGIVSTISAVAPKLAPRVVAAALQTKLDHMLISLPAFPEPPVDATDEERVVWTWKNSSIHVLRKLFEDGTGWYSMAEIAEAAPAEFLEAVWPWFLEVLRRSAGAPNPVLHNYRHDAGFGVVGESPVLDAIEGAVIKLAEGMPDEFLNFVKEWAEEDLFSVQQLLMNGMGKLFSTQPQVALGFLLADARRFEVGNAFDTDGDTTVFINALTPHLSESQRHQLESTIQTWEPHQRVTVSQKPPEERRRFAKWAREARLRLLIAMDPKHLSPKVCDFVVHERRALPTALQRDVTMRGGTVASSMSADQMVKAHDEDILSLFAELTDETGWHHPRRQDFLVGGGLQAASAFGELAKQVPEKAVSIINQLSPGIQEIPVAHAVMGLAESSLPPADLVALIIELDRRGFGSRNFRLYAAWALDKLMEHNYQPPDTICALLESWLEHMQRSGEADATKAPSDSEASIDKSILWGQGNVQALPQGTFTILQTVSRSYLLRSPIEASRWLDLLEHHLSGPEDERSWIFLSRFFSYLKHADHTRAVEFLRALFTRYPRVRDSATGVLLLAQTREWMESEFERECVWAVRDSDWVGGRQAYAELLPFLAVLPAHHWAIDEIETILAASRHDQSPEIASMGIGLAYAAVNLWDNRQYRELATHILIRLLESSNADLRRAIMSLFGIVHFLPPDEFTNAFLRGVLTHPCVLDSNDNTYFVERLSDILPSRPELVAELAEKVVDRVGTTPANLQTGSRLPLAELVNLAMTIQRLSGNIRIRGLALFERLLVLNAYEARGTLIELDNRPTFGRIATPIRRPRRPRRRRG